MKKFGIGDSPRRTEDRRFVTGRGSYVGDLHFPGECFGVLVASQHAHARIKRVDVTSARNAAGVLLVLTCSDIFKAGLGSLTPLVMPPERCGPSLLSPILVDETVRYLGEPVAFIVAETADQARDAADLIEMEFEPLPAVVRVEDAVKPGAPQLWDDCPGNVAFRHPYGDSHKAAEAFAKAAHVVSLELTNNRVSANPIEPRAAVGLYEPGSDRYTLYTNSQYPHFVRQTLARDVFREPEFKFRVVSPDVGGGFGMKAQPYAEDVLVLLSSKMCGRPVKFVSTRSEALARDTHGRDHFGTVELALAENGKVLALRGHALSACGAYIFGAVVAPVEYVMSVLPSVYDIQTVDLLVEAVFTNTAPISAYRGAGRPEAIYFIERLFDHAAAQLNLDPIELRRVNLIRADQLPYTTATKYTYDSGDFSRVLDACLALSRGESFASRRSASEKEGKLRGRAVSLCLEAAGLANEAMEIRFDPGGTVTVLAGTHSHGQGHETAFPQMVAGWLGIPMESIRFVQGDTDQVTIGRGTYAARSAVAGGNSLRRAATAIIKRGASIAAELLQAAPSEVEFEDGFYRALGTNRTVSLPDVAKACFRVRGLAPEFGIGLSAVGSFGFDVPTFPNGCHLCEVEVDPSTGQVRLDTYVAVNDVGRVANPMLAHGQIHGGLAQGLGQALLEEIVYDRDSGQLLTGSFIDYAMPRAADFPEFVSTFVEVPCATNELGLKGCGELGTVGAPPVVMAAILDALRPSGVTDLSMPATSAKIWRALNEARKSKELSH